VARPAGVTGGLKPVPHRFHLLVEIERCTLAHYFAMMARIAVMKALNRGA
jgi:hypothetical protein